LQRTGSINSWRYRKPMSAQAPPNGRGISIVDLLMFIALTGIGFAWTRYNQTNVLARSIEDSIYVASGPAMEDCYPIPRSWRMGWRYVSMSWVFVRAALPCIAVWTIGHLVLSLRKSRLPLQQMATRIGFVACLSASLALVASGVGNFVKMHIYDLLFWMENHRPSPYPEHYWPNLANFIEPSYVGISVISACACGLLGRQLHAEPDWPDRIGRVIGGFWALMVPISWVGRWLSV